MLFVLLGVLAVAVVGIGAVLLTQDDDDGDGSTATEDQSSGEPASAEEQAFIDALAEANAASSEGLIAPDEAECLAQATVDAVGLETLQGATSPEEINADPDASLVELGVEVDQAQVDQFSEATTGCIDVMDVMMQSIEADGGSQELAACVEENLDEDVAATRLAAEFIGNQAARDAAEGEFDDALVPCQEAGT